MGVVFNEKLTFQKKKHFSMQDREEGVGSTVFKISPIKIL